MADFSFEIHRLTPEAPKYNVLATKMEGWRVKRRLKSTAPQRRWTIEIRGRTNGERDSILSHYNGQFSSLIPFNWIVTPIFFGNYTFYVTYEEFEYDNPDGLGNVWNFNITFLEELT
jgi:hypothetical protein